MTEYIVDFGSLAMLSRIVESENNRLGEPVVRCRDCVHYYEAEEYHPQGNYDRRCCKYFDTYDDEVEPDGFCAWGERREP